MVATLTACTTTPAMHVSHVSHDADDSARQVANELMPVAPASEAAWLRAVDRIYDHADRGRRAEEWLRRRMATRRPGQRLAVVLGVDDVMLATHFGGLHTLVARSVRFARVAHELGYAVFYVTGRSATSGLGDVESVLRQSGVPADAVYGRPVGSPDIETGKAQVRASLTAQGYTLAMEVAASEASFDGAPSAEKEVRLPDFAIEG
ncbi:hypothetical protein JCM18899A_35520 [Nocardioides sp. AN3]